MSPGISALTSEHASSWIGISATYADDLASFGKARCIRPSYGRRNLSGADFTQEYHVVAAALGLKRDPMPGSAR